MLGWIHLCVQAMVIKNYDIGVWRKTLEIANIDPDTVYESKVNYSDDETYKIVHALASVLSTTVNDAYEILGEWVIEYACDNGWDELLHAMADNLQQFLDNLNSMHFFIDRIAFESEMKGPVFKCESQNDGSLRLHYYSMRKDLYPMVKGLVRSSSKRLFNIEVLIFVTERLQEKRNNLISEHVIYTIESIEKDAKLSGDVVKNGNLSNTVILEPLSFSMQSFCMMLPMHVCFNKQMIIEHCGEFLQRELMLGRRRTTKLTDIFQIVQPDDIAMSFKGIHSCLNSLFIFQVKSGLERNKTLTNKTVPVPITLKGQMVLVNSGQNMLFIGSLNVSTIRGLVDSNVFISDMQMHDVTRDLIMLNQSRICQQELNKKLEETVKQMRKLAAELELKKAQTDHLLFECIPPEIADQLRKTHNVPAQEFSEATCLMLDMPYFSIINSQCDPKDIVILMSSLFHIYDRLIDLHDCYKVLSIMDCYFIISGVPKICINHADKILNVALGLMIEAKQIIVPKLNLPVMLRIAIHTGPVVAGVLGKKKIRYGVVGETVNITKRLLLNSEPGKILVTNSTRLSAAKSASNAYEMVTKGYINIGNKQATCTYFLEKNIKKSIWELTGRLREENATGDGYKEVHCATVMQKWLNVEADIRKQERVIAALQNKPNHFSGATDKLRKMRESFRSHHHSNDSGFSASSGTESSSSVCSIT